MKKTIWFLKYWLPPILFMLLIFYLSSLPKPPFPKAPTKYGDKFYHFIGYAFFAFLTRRAIFSLSNSMGKGVAVITTILFVAIYALTDEWHQSFVENRSAEVADYVADCLGGIVGSLIKCRK